VNAKVNSNLEAITSINMGMGRPVTDASIHPSWLRLIRYCAELGHGEIEKLKIQDGLPMAAEVTTKKVKFSP
jgi:hypothetical protein